MHHGIIITTFNSAVRVAVCIESELWRVVVFILLLYLSGVFDRVLGARRGYKRTKTGMVGG